MKKFARKVARAAKVACQFKFTCTFEYIDLVCVDGWKPDNLQVVWLRGHRRLDSPTVKWIPKSESGNTTEGRATFDPPIASSLLVTLYQTKDQQEFEQKEYKFYIENEGVNGKKILASFNCNIADFAGIPSERHALDMTFKPVSKKISKALLGLTMESEFLKKGKSSDDDMMSTFSRVSGNLEGDDAAGDDDDDDDPTTSTSSFQNLPVDTNVNSTPSDSMASTVTNGIADESVAATTTVAATASNVPVGILKTSKISTGNGPIEAAILGQVAFEGKKQNSKTEDNELGAVTTKNAVNDEMFTSDVITNGSVVEQTVNKDQVADSDTTVNGAANIAKSGVEDRVNNSNLPLHDNDISTPSVDVELSPPVTIEPVPPVTIEPVPPVTIEPVPPVTIEPVPPVTIEPVPPVTIEPVPPVTIEPVPPVTIEPVPPVTIEPVPPVTIEPVPPVTIEPVPPVTIEPVPPVTIEPVPPVTIEPVPPVTIEPVPPVTIEPVPPLTIEPVPPVTIEPVPPVTIEPVPPVTIEPVPPVTIEPVPPVTIEPVPPVTIEPVPPVTIEPVPPVTIEPVPPVTIEPVPPVTIEPVPPVTIEPVPPVTIEPVPPVTIEPVPPVTIEPVPPVTIEPVPPVTIEPVPPVTIEPVPPVTIEPVPPLTIEPVPPVTVEPAPLVTVNQEVQSKAAATDQTNAMPSANQDVTKAKSKKNKFGKNKSPPIEVSTSPEVSKFVAGPAMEGPCWLPDDIALVDMDGQPVPKITLDQTDIIGLYFSAEWCTPCKKFMPKLLKFYNYLKKEERSFQIVYVSSDNTKDAMMGYMKEQNMPWVGLDFDSSLGEQLRGDFKVSAIPMLCIVSRNGEIITDSTKKPVDSASSSEEEMTRLFNRWIRRLLEIKGLPVPEEVEPEKKKGLLSSLFGGKKKDKQQNQQPAPQTDATATTTKNEDVDEAPPASRKKSDKDAIAEELLRQKEQLEHERTLERQVVQEKTQKLHVTLELNAQMQKDLSEKEERIRILEAKNETLRQSADTKTDEIENLKQKIMMLEQELSSKADEERKLLDEKKELLANISLHGWLCKKGIKGPTANTWRRRYFKIEEGSKLAYYKSAGDGPPQGYIEIDKIVSVKALPGAQQDKTNCAFHVVTEGRTYELLAHDEVTMNKWINSLQYMKEWRAKQKREAKH